MIVADASAIVAGLLTDGSARHRLAHDDVHVPHLADIEVTAALARQVRRQAISGSAAEAALAVWTRLGVSRYATVTLLDRVWELRHNLSAYHATYVSLAEALGTTLLTADVRLAAAPGPRCPIETVPR